MTTRNTRVERRPSSERQDWSRVAITGLGKSQVGRRLGRTPVDLTLEACLRAIDDAGLTRADIDGLVTYPGGRGPTAGVEIPEVHDALDLDLRWYFGGGESPSSPPAIVNACLAVTCGLARHVLVYKSVVEAARQGTEGRKGIENLRIIPAMQWAVDWLAPFGSLGIANWVAPYAQRHMHEHGITREQLAWIPIVQRRHAGLNPDALYRDPLTMDDYVSARMISDPLCLYDCDVPVDMSIAMIVSSAETLGDLRSRPVRLDAVGMALRDRPSWDQFSDPPSAGRDAANELWSQTSLTQNDVDVALLYDGFSILAMMHLEALGFCGPGEGGAFVEGGSRISIGGDIPLNTDGGHLSAGRSRGFGQIYEACRQLRQEAGARQVADAEVAVAGGGGGPVSTFLLLTR
jgi:acetyl-CoA acetyltransferase